jgi:ATP-binding cassette subfamily F protein 3
MRLIAGLEDPQTGFVEFGSGSIISNYYQQNQADAMDLDRTVLETVQDGAPSEYTFTEVRALLGQFMFKGDDVDKKLRVLSGGEKARVALCKMMLTPANLLLLGNYAEDLVVS